MLRLCLANLIATSTAAAANALGVRLLMAVVILCVTTSASYAAEPVAEFLEALRSKGLHDLTLAYLDSISSGDAVTADVRATIPYEKGVTLVTAALSQRQLAGKAQYLDEAHSAFDAFRKSSPDHPLALSANGQLGNILVERARIKILQGDRPSTAPEQRTRIQQEARALLDQAGRVYLENRDQIRGRLEQFPKTLDPDKDAQQIKERDQLRSEYVQSQFVAAMVQYEKSQTYDPKSSEYRRGLTDADQQFAVVAKKYRRRLAGLSASLFQGRCQQQLSKPKDALSYYEDLLTLPSDEPALRPIVTKALRGAMECWLDEQVDQTKRAIERGEAWLQKQRPNERNDPDWLALKLNLVKAYKTQAQDERGREKMGLLADARKLAIEVAKQKGETQEEAHELLAQLGVAPRPSNDASAQINSFDAAMEAAKEAISQRQLAAGTISLLERRLPQIKDRENRKEVETRLKEARGRLKQTEDQALDLFEKARQLAGSEVAVEELNTLRYYLCTLYYYRGDFYSATVLGDFLARRYPDSMEGRRSASVVLASLVRLYGDGQAPHAGQVVDRIEDTADYIANRWAGQAEADEALGTLVTLAVQSGDTELAEANLKRISEKSPKRGAAQLATGQLLWNRASTEGDTEMQQRAIALMTSGLELTADQPHSATRVLAALSLIQFHLDQGEASEALALLEDPRFGPKTLVDQKHPAASSPALRQRTYTLAIIAYVATLAETRDTDSAVNKALTTLDMLKRSLDDDPAGSKRLSAIYVMLARSLQKQISKAPARSRAAISAAFQQFLDRAASTTTDLNVRNWIADSYLTMSREFVDATGRATIEGAALLAKAAEVYKSILQQAADGQLTLTPLETLQTKNRLAVSYREMGEFSKALDVLSGILQTQETQVYVQLEAARTLQRWGDHGNPDAYLKAIRGDRRKANVNRNLIWGYGRIAKIVATSEKLRDMFHDARYSLARCRYEHAIQQPKSQRMTELKQAEQDILGTARLYPKMGGEARKAEYTELLGRIQRAMGKKPTGIK